MISKSESGFTLTELVVVLAIVTLAAAIAFPSLKRAQGERSVALLSERITGALYESRLRAIAKNEVASLEFNLDKRIFGASGNTPVMLPPNVKVELLTARGKYFASNPSYRFFPDGSSTGGSIKLTGEKMSYTIKLRWLTGEIETETSKLPQ